MTAGGGKPVSISQIEMHAVERGTAMRACRQQHEAERG